MPATEQTWRNLKILHVVFGLVALVLLLATVLMLAADHNRPWKKYARGFRNLETWSAAARVAEQDSAAYESRREELEAQLAARGGPISMPAWPSSSSPRCGRCRPMPRLPIGRNSTSISL